MLNYLKKSNQILGMNSRNLNFIRPGNTKKAIALVDDKLRTKSLLKKHGLPVSEIIAVIKNRKDFYNFDWDSLPNSFVLKPNRGLGGEGIMVTFGRKKNGRWVLPLNKDAGLKDIFVRVSNILDGDYSKTNSPDSAFFEERLKIHPTFKLYSYKGVPDIRVIVYNKVPVMAMLRLPTKSSNGKANLHKGGVGVGIDIATGKTTYAFLGDKIIEYLPDFKAPLRGIQIPYWNQILELAVKSTIASGLSYCGVDIAIDREKGPVILELNAHPGLSIQIANMTPLKERLLRVKGLKIETAKKGIKVAKELFGVDYDQEVEEITGKKILGIINKIKIQGKNKQVFEVEAKIDTGATITSISEELARQMGFGEALDYFNTFNIKENLTKEELDNIEKEKKPEMLAGNKDIIDTSIIHSSHGTSYRIQIPILLTLAGFKIQVKANVYNRQNLKYDVIIGKRDLGNFLIDSTK